MPLFDRRNLSKEALAVLDSFKFGMQEEQPAMPEWSVPVPLTLEQFLQQYVLARADNDTMGASDDVALAVAAWNEIQRVLRTNDPEVEKL